MASKKKDKQEATPKKQTESRSYDKIFKENIEPMFELLVVKELDLDIESSEELKDKLQTTLEREADFLRKIYPKHGSPYILHVEFQTKNESNMIYRLQEYHAIIQKKYKLPVRQFVIFLGKGKMTMRSEPKKEEVYKGFTVVNLAQKAYQSYIDSDIPEQVILALLADFGQEKDEEVIDKILSRLVQLKTDEVLLSKYINQLFVLARLRGNLDVALSKQINNMALTIDIEQSILFKKGLEKGIEKGIEKGKLEGILEGELKGKLEGKMEGKMEQTKAFILNGHANGLEIPMLANITQISEAEVLRMIKENGLK
jgi:predicted transposase YdaD